MSKVKSSDLTNSNRKFDLAKSHDLSPRSQWLRDYYFKGVERDWNNEYMCFTSGLPGDRIWSELDYYIVPELYFYMGTKTFGVFGTSLNLMAQKVELNESFWSLSLPERRMVFFEKVMLEYIPQEIIGPELLCGGQFNTQLSKCLDKNQQKKFNKLNFKARNDVFEFHNYGFGNVGTTAGHIIADYETIIKKGFRHIYEKASDRYNQLTEKEKSSEVGAELRAIKIASEIPRKLALKYTEECNRIISESNNLDPSRIEELKQMARNCTHVPWEPATTFWEGIQSIWLTHMLIMSEESYPGPGVSFGRMDQYLWDLYKKDILDENNITKEFAKDILGSFWFHCNTAYDAQIKIGKQGITSGFGQLLTLSGCGRNGKDLTNELTYTFIELIDEWSPILEPKPNIRLHKNSPDKLLNIIVEMITKSQGAPFILNFDERSIEGLILEGIPRKDAWDYACVGCLENTMQGNDKSGTVNCNPNLAKSIELTLWNGKTKFEKGNILKKPKQLGPKSGDPEKFRSWEEFWNAWIKQIEFLIKYTVDVHNKTEDLRAEYLPTPYLSSIVRGCIERGKDVRNGGPEIRFITIEGVGYATLVDSLLSIKKYVFEEKKYSITELKNALLSNFEGDQELEKMRVWLANRAPKFGNNNDEADNLASEVMKIWSSETFKYNTNTDFQYRPGMLSWNYWAGEDAAFTPATPNGRKSGTFLSNAICPTNGADLKGPTANVNSVGIVLRGNSNENKYSNYLPNGASHTITFNPSLLRNPEHKEKFKAFLRGYIENGGTALQVNILDAKMLKDAQLNPQNYSNLLVRVTGYNAYFTAIGKELQDEIISREMHQL